MFGKLSEKNMTYRLMFDKPESKKLDDSLMSLSIFKWVFAQKLWGYPEYFTDLSPKTAAINIPVMVVSGTKDYTIGVDHYKLMKFPNMQVKFVEGGHALYLEHNEELYYTVAPFLKQYSK